MIRWMTWINLVGVLAAAALCGRQWTENALVRGIVVQLDNSKQAADTKLAEQMTLATTQQHDLDTLRGQLTTSEAELAAAKQKLATTTAERDSGKAEIDKQRAALDQWKAAVADRDKSLKDAGVQVQTLVAARDDAVRRYNELVTRFNQQQKGDGK